ncbi:MAG: ABC transporter ATP-binding protein [Flavobacteriales bacterium]
MSSSSKRTFNWGVLWRVIDQVKPYRGRFILTGVFVLVLAGLAPVRPYLIGRAMDVEMASGDLPGLLNIFALVVGLLVIESIFQFYQTYLANYVAQSVTLDLRSRLYDHVLGFRLRFFDQTPVGTFVTRLVSDIDGIARVFSQGLLNIVGDVLRLIVVIIVMLATNWKLSLIVLLPIPILLFATRVFQRVVKQAFVDVRNMVSKLNVFVQEHVTGMAVVQIFNREKHERAQFEQLNRQHRKANIRTIWAFSIFFPVVELLSAASVALLLWWGMGDVARGVTTGVGQLMQFTLYVFMLYRPIRQLADRFTVLQEGVVNAERVFKLFDRGERIDQHGERYPEKIQGNIAFENVWFAYNDEAAEGEHDWVIRDLTLQVKAGQTVAFVGATGAGKSSVINILSRFYEYQKGTVKVDDHSLRDLSLAAIRHHIAVVLQDVFLFSDSIHNNVTLGDPSITREQVIAASKAVGAHDFISKLPGGYDYDVKERGAQLSVGQRQLVAFIRAYVYNPSILVLDEATSSVDTESELLIQGAIEKLTQGRTSIIIAHRLSTIQEADNIIVLDEGRIREQGSHAELLQQDGHYRKLFELQFQD